jgi:protein-S-isoprenylcysteine O-methyltransferase Ste14
MYASVLLLWLGWAAFFGRLAVLAGLLALCVLLAAVVPREERALEAQFGEEYRRSCPRRTPRTGHTARGGRRPSCH